MANELRFVGGDLLFDGGSLAMSADCCCDAPVEVSCNSRTFTVPASVTVNFGSVGDYNDTTPNPCDSCDSMGGTKTLPLYLFTACNGFFCNLQYALFSDDEAPCSELTWRYFVDFIIPCSGTGNINAIATPAAGAGGAMTFSKSITFTTDLTGLSLTLDFDGPGSSNCDVHPATVGLSS